MEYYAIWCREQNPIRHMNFVTQIYPRRNEGDKIRPHPFYEGVACKKCNHVSMEGMKKRGAPDDLRLKVRGGTDILETSDRPWHLVSSRAKEVMGNIDSMLKFIPVPNYDFYLVIPRHTVPIDVKKTSMKQTTYCRSCKRRTYNGAITAESLLTKRSTPQRIFTPTPFTATTFLCCSETVKQELDDANLSGMTFSKMWHMSRLDKFKDE